LSTRRFENQSVLITGAARGFGKRAAERFAAEGARLTLSDIDEAALAEVGRELRAGGAKAVVFAGDIAQEKTSQALVALARKAYGRLDIAVNNAGMGQPFEKLVNTSAETMRRLLDINVMGVFFGMKHQLAAMEPQGAGVIVNVASVAGLVGAPLLAAYAASKHAVVGLTKSAAGEAARKGIRVNALCPAFAKTDMVLGMTDAMQGGAAEAEKRIVSNMPMRRYGEIDEVVEAMLFLCDAKNSFMTGHALAVDGGLSAV
jgi:NAD(P)-dependent dehydrogenase (short-subunit alcohol dehydrogenase family)